jgi:fatty acid/phospholipid biosynthesis enzyme
MNIGLDMMGGDFAPLEAVKGVAEFLNNAPADTQLTLIGNEEQIKAHLINHPSFMLQRSLKCMSILPKHSRKKNSHPLQ